MTSQADRMRLLGEVNVDVSVELGRTQMPLQQVLNLGEDSVVALDRLTDELLDVQVNGKLIAKAEIIAQDGRFALKIVELVGHSSDRPLAAQTEEFAAEPAPEAPMPGANGQGSA